ncbi:TetR/AcrR family transcriptional regulator [Kribbella sp. NPDC056861]|uniref:TetR/AcrR family transcriptional regulator n=1 Tax=Kribbella sp. NPDC056861 TaxID=3154857 RepID=UPI0034223E64
MAEPNPDRRNERSRQAILTAALELCQEQNFAKVTMEGIAKRAGVGKQTIYRWWPSKAAILLEALRDRARASDDFPDTGDIVADLRDQMTQVVEVFNDPVSAGYNSGLIAAAQSDPDIAKAIVDFIVQPRVEHCANRLKVAQQAGQVRDDVAAADIVELLYAPLYYRFLLHTRPVSVEQLDLILELAFAGLTPR